MSDCAKIMIPFVEALGATGGETENEACLLDTMQFIGGVASAALQDPATRFDPIDRLIIAPAGFELSSIRDNGSRRDLDLLVLDTRPEKIAEVETLAGSCIGDELKISVFGLHQATELGRMKAHPFGKRAYWSAVSDRYVSPSPDLGQPPKLEKSIFPFAANLPPECLETWNLQLGKPGEEFVIPVAHPGSALLNYATRSLAGLRGKDAVKVRKMADNLLAKDPEMKDWLLGGPGQ
ncbi:MAG: hypothetical protein ACREGF_02500, partial [Candidatus Saccharimonadales bacterium]